MGTFTVDYEHPELVKFVASLPAPDPELSKPRSISGTNTRASTRCAPRTKTPPARCRN